MITLNKEITLREMDRLAMLAQDKCSVGHIAYCLDWPEAKVRKVAKDNGIHIFNIGEK